ncbi:M48B family peptidase [Thalassoporum mexicanum PCC 7367]|uniref:M48 family metalloprotease n=1 Tax=Thalassoporum mexicanum TaxID=3457544 RepID=UPI00029FBB5A|nr:M48 family metalloprotease [Pseudanabaena sp. PCC 7367]AFY68648.1 M48B family peptidase [Pseudanabaena sp. PCC 7367]
MSLKAGKEALLRKHYTEAIAILSEYSHGHPDPTAKDYIQAQIWIVTAYQRSGRADKAIAICEQLADHPDPQLQTWLQKSLVSLQKQLEAEPNPAQTRNEDVAEVIKSKPNRYRRNHVTLALPFKYKFMFILAMVGTVLLVLGLIAGIFLWLATRVTLEIGRSWFILITINTIVIGTLMFFMSPWLIDITQKRFQRTQWITLFDLEAISPEAVELIENFCADRNRDIPRIGLIADDSPVAFVYGVLPNSARLVISRGLLDLLSDDEIAAVFAYQLGRVATWSFSVTTFAAAPVQLVYLFYVYLSRLSFRTKRGKNAFRLIAAIANFFYRCSNYLLFPITRSSAYVCDHFAAELTGNPNAMSRALTKIARGIVEQGQLRNDINRLLESTRALGICDHQTAIAVGTAFMVLHSGYWEQNPTRVFLWELYNPWSSWIEFHSPLPLIGRRLRTLTLYTRQLGLNSEFEFLQIMKEGKALKKAKLYRNFSKDVIVQVAPYGGAITGLILAKIMNPLFNLYNNWLPWQFILIGLGIGIMFQGTFRYPDFRRVVDGDLVSLLNDPYASTLRGQPVQLPGELIGYDPDINQLGYNLKLEDQAGMINLNYLPNYQSLVTNSSRAIRRIETLIGQSVVATGWFRRGNLPIVDLSSLKPLLTDEAMGIKILSSYHQLWNNLISSLLVLAGLLPMTITYRVELVEFVADFVKLITSLFGS